MKNAGKFLRAEFIATGSELLGPHRAEKNSLFLADELSKFGIAFQRKTVVGDSKRDISNAVSEALKRADLVILSGGLGATSDDLTASAVSDALKITPRDFTHLKNPFGTAPGLFIKTARAAVILLPGVPYEMKAVFKEVVPLLKRLAKKYNKAFTRSIRIAEMSEVELEKILKRVGVPPQTKLGITVSPGAISIHLTVISKSEKTAKKTLDGQMKKYKKILGSAVFGEGRETLEEVVGRMLARRRKTLAVAESCTGGFLAERVTAVAGSSRYFLGGAVTYGNKEKTRILGVPPRFIKEEGAVSAAVVRAMARGARKKFRSDYALAISGVAGPGGGTKINPVGTVWIALSAKEGEIAKKYRFPGDRDAVRMRSAYSALNELRLAMITRRRRRIR